MKSQAKILDRIAKMERKIRCMVNNPEFNRLREVEKLQAELAQLYWVLKD